MSDNVIPNKKLNAIIAGSVPVPAHVQVLASAMRDGGVRLAMVPQRSEPFQANNDRPTVFVIGDDTKTALGPDGFHLPSVRRAIRSCAAFSIISCEALTEAYACPVATAVMLRENVMIIETRLEQEAAWYNLVQKLAPDRPILLATVKGGRA